MTTRVRLFKLGQEGTFASYFDGTSLTLIDPVLTEDSVEELNAEVAICGGRIALLHLTSWDADHCNRHTINEFLRLGWVDRIQLPGYPPHNADATAVLNLIRSYAYSVKIEYAIPATLTNLPSEQNWHRGSLLCWPYDISNVSNNDNSTVVLFRTGDVSLLSCGDIESPEIMSYILRSPSIRNEVDVILLPHHGAGDQATSLEMLRAISPSVALVGSNWANQFDHPAHTVRGMLSAANIPLYTSKTRSVLIESTEHRAIVTDFDEAEGSAISFVPKRSQESTRRAILEAFLGAEHLAPKLSR